MDPHVDPRTGLRYCGRGIVEDMAARGEEQLTRALRAGDEASRGCVVRPEELDALVALVMDDTALPGARSYARRALGLAAAPERSLPILTDPLDGDAVLHVGAPAIPAVVELLEREPDYLALLTLALLMEDHPLTRAPEAANRQHAARVLGLITDLTPADEARVSEALRPLTRDPDPEVVSAAQEALGRLAP